MSADPTDDLPPFACAWQREGDGSASVRASGRLDARTAPWLARTLRDALAGARLVLLELRHAPADETGARAIIDGSVRAREAGKRLLVIGAPPSGDPALAAAIAASQVAWLQSALPASSGPSSPAPENPVNARVVRARVMDVPSRLLWLHGEDGILRRAWVPPTAPPATLVGRSVQVYVDPEDALNGWYDPASGLAINQRRLGRASAAEPNAALACQGRCGIVWRTPAPAELVAHDEHCLTCAGPLVPA